ncbi:MAG: DNA starvation/stationary phase protection protein Dps [Bdellovibrionia bacterium]
MFKTKIDLSEPIRSKVVEMLNQRVAECIDLTLQAKQAHWNVKGPNFRSLHKLFDTVSSGVQKSGDLLAERLVQLGGIAMGTVEAVIDQSRLQAYPLTIMEEADHLDALSTSIASCGKAMRESIDAAVEWKDEGTSDLLLRTSQKLDKYLWMVEAHLQGRTGELSALEKEERRLQSRQLKSASGG